MNITNEVRKFFKTSDIAQFSEHDNNNDSVVQLFFQRYYFDSRRTSTYDYYNIFGYAYWIWI